MTDKELLDFDSVNLTKEQEERVKKIFAFFDEEDYSFEVRYGYEMVQGRVYSSLAGRLHADNIPFTPVFRMAFDYAWERYNNERRK